MHSGSPDELRAKEQRAQTLAGQIAELLNELAETGHVSAHNGQITGLGVTIHCHLTTGWTATPDCWS